MNVEENRLRTFSGWPVNAPIDPTRLAKGGFYATGNLLETECHWCHKKISDWQYGDQIMARHRRLFPLCMFIVNPNESGNVPLIAAPNSTNTSSSSNLNGETPSSNSVEQVDLKNEMNRLATFKNWPNPNISPEALSKAGFYYLNQSDQVKCAWCKGVIAKWEKNDNAFEEHKRFFPDCPRVQLGPLIEIANDGIRDLGIQQISPPKKPKYSSLDARMRTYAQWPISDVQKPESLAQSGFYYQGIDDQVRCFHCNGGLRSWQKEDDPWFDHAKWFPHCQFVKLVKSPQYVTQVQELARQMSQNENCGTQHESENVMTLDEAMCTSPVLQALEMGLNAACIRNATQRQLENCGQPYETNEELVKAVLGGQADDADDEDPMADQPSRATRRMLRIINCFMQDVRSEGNRLPQPAYSELATVPCMTSSTSVPAEPLLESMLQSAALSSSGDQKAAVPGPSKWVEKTPQSTITPDSFNEKKMSLEEENRKLKDARLCKVCMDEEVGVVFLPCGHLVTCVQCAPGVTQCPLCRTEIKGFVRTFLS